MLGIDPDPRIGGISGGVAYIAFTGAVEVDVIEDHAMARQPSESRTLAALLGLVVRQLLHAAAQLE